MNKKNLPLPPKGKCRKCRNQSKNTLWDKIKKINNKNTFVIGKVNEIGGDGCVMESFDVFSNFHSVILLCLYLVSNIVVDGNKIIRL